MKRIITLVCIIIFLTGCIRTKSSYLIKGEFVGSSKILENKIVYIKSLSKDYSSIDSTKVKNGRFQFSGRVTTPDNYIISVKEISGNIPIFLENEEYKVYINASNIADSKVLGGTTQAILDQVKEKELSTREKYNLDNVLVMLTGKSLSKERKEELDKIVKAANDEMTCFIDSIKMYNPYSCFTLINTINKSHILDYKILEKLLKRFNEKKEFQGNRYLDKLKDIVHLRANLEIGKMAPDLFLIDNFGKQVRLSKICIGNNFNLIIFWAGWDENSIKNLLSYKELYHKYQSKGLQIIDVNIEDSESNWKNAITKIGNEWIHLIDVKDPAKSASHKYLIELIPANYLLDKNGKIIAKDATVEYMQKALADFK